MLGKSSTDILMFGIVLTVFVIAFGTAGFLTFNSDVDDFRSYVFSMGNMVRFTLVDMDYGNLTLSARLWGSFFYYLWSLLMLLILANVFIAILTEAYSQVQMELTEEDKLPSFLGMSICNNIIVIVYNQSVMTNLTLKGWVELWKESEQRLRRK